MNRISAISGILASAAVAAVCLSATGAYATSSTPITIVNNLNQALVFDKIKARESVKITESPPQEIAAGSKGKFKIAVGSKGGNEHLNIHYTIKGTEKSVAIVYRYNKLQLGKKRCPKEVPDSVKETVQHCGNYDSKEWTYTFDPK